ncbi:MAG: phosphatase [Piscirickettsiaceae bacterium]|nr:MAG: phosphatase [Piscirickettsiaceae bacterium]
MKVDLHSHTLVSDGHLSPKELVARAIENDVDILSITDHDSTGAYVELGDLNAYSIKLIPGIELSTQWRGIGVHIVGLNIDLDNEVIQAGVKRQAVSRAERAELIAKRLIKLGLSVDLVRVKAIAGGVNIGRPHFAQHLVEIGAVKDFAMAFKKYLGNGKAGDVKQCWAALPDIVGWITASGGTAVLAHPLKYKMTRTKLSALLDEFSAVGGQAMEVVSGVQTNDVTGQMGALCKEKNLLASCGSDFHQPSQWSEIGRMSALPKQCEPVWATWL